MQPHQSIHRLIILWALNESALGGIMHALKIPFTGFFVGGFAVICIALIAWYSNFDFKQILKATLLVILVKSAVSPHSPVAAYFAVAFQGFLGALIFCILKNFTIASILFGFIALVESALQKFILLTILFGKSLWQALDIFINDTLKIFSLSTDFSFSYYLIATYTLVYAIWGLLLGFWISKLPKQIHERAPDVIAQFKLIETKKTESFSLNAKEKRTHKLFWVVAALAVISTILLNKNYPVLALTVLARTIAVLFIVFYVITPLIKWLLKKSSIKNKEAMDALVNNLPQMQKLVIPSWKLASKNSSGLNKYKEFIFTLIVAALNNKPND